MRTIAALWLICFGLACAADGSTAGREEPSACTGGQVRDCSCDDGSVGQQTCLTGWQPCSCAPTDPADFDNGPAQAGTAAPMVVTAQPAPRMKLEHCDPGLYLGTYDCELDFLGLVTPFMGDVSFNLEINEMVDEKCDSLGEFCADLVISEGSGTLYGIAAALWGFEAPLRGGLDCTTGEFRTEPLDGIWGAAVSSDPADPGALWTVAEPPAGTFAGELAGMHSGTEPQIIAGNWNLSETASMSTCVGPFRVELQP